LTVGSTALALVIVDLKNRGGIRLGRDIPKTFCVLLAGQSHSKLFTIICHLSYNYLTLISLSFEEIKLVSYY
jgi:hypothetical protein